MSTAINQVRCGVTRIASVSWASCIHPVEKVKKGNLKLSQLNKAKHDERKSHTAKKQGTVIIGDSMVKGLHQHKLVNSVNQNIMVKCFLGATVVDMSDYIKPVLRRKPVLHVGTNDTQGCIKYFIFWDYKANENIFCTQTLGILCLNLITKQNSVYSTHHFIRFETKIPGVPKKTCGV